MQKIMLSYRFTGEDPRYLDEVLGNVSTGIRNAGYDVFCSFFLEDYFRKERLSAEEIYAYCLQEQEDCDVFVSLITSENKSSGMEKELEKSKELGQRNILLIRDDLDFSQFRSAAHQVIEYHTLPELYSILEKSVFE